VIDLDLTRARDTVQRACRPHYRGRVEEVSGVVVEAEGVPAAVGEVCRIERRDDSVDAEVVGFRGTRTLLMPHGDVDGIAPGQPVYALGRTFTVQVGDELLGRTLNGLGDPIDGRPALLGGLPRPVRREAPAPLERPPIAEPLTTGVRAIDGFATLGRGQRLGIFAGSGVGKSMLLGQITRGTDAQVVVVCLVGERGREVQEFREQVLAQEDSAPSVLVVATSDRPPIERFLAPFVAMTVAEHFRDQGLEVLLVIDSITRFALASREIGLAAGEPPTVRGFPPSFFATVPKLVERMGRTEQGSITGLLTVLLEGDDPHEPVADTLRGLLDGHLLLSRDLASEGHYPAIDVLESLSRLMPHLASQPHQAAAGALRSDLATYKAGRDLVDIGAYREGANPRLDQALARLPAIHAFLQQGTHDPSSLEETLELLGMIAGAGEEQAR